MHWIITKDLLGDEPHTIGHGDLPWGNYGPPRELKLAAERAGWVEAYLGVHGAEFPYEFRLLDDDEEPYYEGRCGNIEDTDGDSAFAPIDWAEGNAGCTILQFRKVGGTEWEWL